MKNDSERCVHSINSVPSVIATCFLLVASAGCHMIVDPYHDEMAGLPPVSTPSTLGLREADVTPRTIQPIGDAKTVSAKTGAVLHGPLYFEDPYDESGSEDGQFAITCEDHVAFLASGVRFLVNADLFGISFLVTPPWMPMASDGYPDRALCCGLHDATPVVDSGE